MARITGKVYRPDESPETGDPAPAGLALGATWFWHGEQTLLQALASHPRVAPAHAAIRLPGFNGARLNQYIGDGAYADIIRTRLAPPLRFSEFYLGGAANDALEYGLALHDDCAGAADPAGCLSPERLDLLLVLASDPAHHARDWDNELYPSVEGFTKILERAWFPWLKPFGIVR